MALSSKAEEISGQLKIKDSLTIRIQMSKFSIQFETEYYIIGALFSLCMVWPLGPLRLAAAAEFWGTTGKGLVKYGDWDASIRGIYFNPPAPGPDLNAPWKIKSKVKLHQTCFLRKLGEKSRWYPFLELFVYVFILSDGQFKRQHIKILRKLIWQNIEFLVKFMLVKNSAILPRIKAAAGNVIRQNEIIIILIVTCFFDDVFRGIELGFDT